MVWRSATVSITILKKKKQSRRPLTQVQNSEFEEPASLSLGPNLNIQHCQLIAGSSLFHLITKVSFFTLLSWTLPSSLLPSSSLFPYSSHFPYLSLFQSSHNLQSQPWNFKQSRNQFNIAPPSQKNLTTQNTGKWRGSRMYIDDNYAFLLELIEDSEATVSLSFILLAEIDHI